MIKRPPDFIVGSPDNPYLHRWWIIPRNRFFNIYLHKFLRSDDDRALHDHPWWNASFILKGGYLEWKPKFYINGRPYGMRSRWRGRWSVIFRSAKGAHRLELSPTAPTCWSLFFTGPTIRQWGFWCPKGWRYWKDFVSVYPGGNDVGRGCED